MMASRTAGWWVATALGLMVTVAPARSQDAGAVLAERALASRDSLAMLAKQLERDASPSAAALLPRVKARLETGDFLPGDRILLLVHGESTLTDTFTVGPDRRVLLPPPVTGSMPLQGVLRSELDSVARDFVSQFLQHPVMTAHAMMRLAVQGEVERAGIHSIPAGAVLADALHAAGGATARADLRKLHIERDGRKVWEGSALQRALADGVTIDQALLRSGDRIVVGSRGAGVEASMHFLWLVVSLVGGIYGLTRVF
jgi:protein involved in polysaccharide export with SLBB domain